MVKRAKLTLDNTEAMDFDVEKEAADFTESVGNEQTVNSDSQSKLGKMLLIAGLTIISLIIFRQKIF